MSEQQESAPVLKKVVAKVMAFLKLDDSGRVDKFFDKQIKMFRDKIKAVEQNMSSAKTQFALITDKHADALEDAEEALEEAYLAIKPDEISSNDAIKAFSDIYWNNIKSKEDDITALKETMKAKQEAYDEELKNRQEKIAKYEARIAKISELV
jgi:F0F1-type ATP synthase membrane subunit b/b'